MLLLRMSLRVQRWHTAIPLLARIRQQSTAGSSRSVVLSDRRLDEFVTAEISYFAGKSPQPVKLSQIFRASTPALAAALIHEQLPKHFATRIKHIEALPHWDAFDELQEVHRTLRDSFRNLRLLPRGSDLEPLTEAIKDLRQRHRPILNLLSVAIAHLRAEGVDEVFVDQWLDEFLLARIGTEMLTLHFLKLSSGEDGHRGSCTGIVDSRCDPGKVCRDAVAAVSADPKYTGVPICVESNASEKGIAFQFMPIYLKLLVTELLKNSVSATKAASSASPDTARDRVTVFVGADDYQVMIEISDKGGGIPPQYAERIWSYSWATSGSPSSGKHSGPVQDELMPSSWSDPLVGLGIKQRLGMGLPLTRLYTQYLGGSLELMSIPGVGVDTFINLRRIDQESLLPPDNT